MKLTKHKTLLSVVVVIVLYFTLRFVFTVLIMPAWLYVK